MCYAFVSLGHNVKLIIPNLINKGEKLQIITIKKSY